MQQVRFLKSLIVDGKQHEAGETVDTTALATGSLASLLFTKSAELVVQPRQPEAFRKEPDPPAPAPQQVSKQPQPQQKK